MFTVEEVAGILKIPVVAVERMVQDKQIKSLRLGGLTRIPRRALLACLRGMSADEFDDLLLNRAHD